MRNHNHGARGGNAVFDKADLAIGTTTSQISHSAIEYMIDGLMYSLAASADKATGAAAEQAVSTTALYLLGVNAAGSITVVKSDEVLTALLTNDVESIDWPVMTAGYVPFGAIKIVTNSSTTFTLGTTALNASGVTATYYDIGQLPAGPITS